MFANNIEIKKARVGLNVIWNYAISIDSIDRSKTYAILAIDYHKGHIVIRDDMNNYATFNCKCFNLLLNPMRLKRNLPEWF